MNCQTITNVLSFYDIWSTADYILKICCEIPENSSKKIPEGQRLHRIFKRNWIIWRKWMFFRFLNILHCVFPLKYIKYLAKWCTKSVVGAALKLNQMVFVNSAETDTLPAWPYNSHPNIFQLENSYHGIFSSWKFPTWIIPIPHTSYPQIFSKHWQFQFGYFFHPNHY